MQYEWLIGWGSEKNRATHASFLTKIMVEHDTNMHFSDEQQDSPHSQYLIHSYQQMILPPIWQIFQKCPAASAMDAPVSRAFASVFDFSLFTEADDFFFCNEFSSSSTKLRLCSTCGKRWIIVGCHVYKFLSPLIPLHPDAVAVNPNKCKRRSWEHLWVVVEVAGNHKWMVHFDDSMQCLCTSNALVIAPASSSLVPSSWLGGSYVLSARRRPSDGPYSQRHNRMHMHACTQSSWRRWGFFHW